MKVLMTLFSNMQYAVDRRYAPGTMVVASVLVLGNSRYEIGVYPRGCKSQYYTFTIQH